MKVNFHGRLCGIAAWPQRMRKIKYKKINDKKFNYKKIQPFLLLGMLTLFFCWFFVGRYGIFGSKVDWISQHSVIPDYFRQQFYHTGELFPEYAANIGGGQNIYHFSYYGLYSPVILFSYLFPSVKMEDYLMAASIVSLCAAVQIFFGWLLKRGFSKKISFMAALMYLLSGPMIFQSYSQVMFVSYMPFLCMAFLGVDRYFEKGKSALFTVSVFFMIMSSFYFSIGGMLALVLYGIHRYAQMQGKVTVGKFLADGVRFCLPMLCAVLMCGILLVPTAAALSGRGNGGNIKFSLASLLIPRIEEAGNLLYTPYGVGMTTLMITVLIAGIMCRQLKERILAWGCVVLFSVPIFSWLLNGGLYIRDKVWIPFLPLLCYLAADYVQKQKDIKISVAGGLIPYLLTIALLLAGTYSSDSMPYKGLILLDAAVMAAAYLLSRKSRNTAFLLAPPVLFLLLFGSVFHQQADRIESREVYEKVTDSAAGRAVAEAAAGENGFYRVEQAGSDAENAANLNRIRDMGQYISSVYSSCYNEEYDSFRKNIFQVEEPYRNSLMQPVSKNPLFLNLMGVKYLISEQPLPGLREVGAVDGWKICENPGAAPVIYATDRVISREEYEKLEFPYNQLVFCSAAVAGADSAGRISEETFKGIEPADFALPQTSEGAVQIEEKGDGYKIHAEKKETVNIEIPPLPGTEEKERILFLQFRVKNCRPNQDMAISLEGQRNKLTSKKHIYYNGNTTFSYAVLLGKGQKSAKLDLGKGEYEITGIQCFQGAWENIQGNRGLYQSEFQPDKEKTRGNVIAGSVDVKKEGYCITSIPYDSHYIVRIDGKETGYEKVNMAFLGFPAGEGRHRIEIIYHAPGFAAGKYTSLLGLALFFALRFNFAPLLILSGAGRSVSHGLPHPGTLSGWCR